MRYLTTALIFLLTAPANADLLFPPDMKIQEVTNGGDGFLSNLLGIWYGDMNADGHIDGVAFTEIGSAVRSRTSIGSSDTVVTAILSFGHPDPSVRKYIQPMKLRVGTTRDSQLFQMVSEASNRNREKLSFTFGTNVDVLEGRFTHRHGRMGPANFQKAKPNE